MLLQVQRHPLQQALAVSIVPTALAACCGFDLCHKYILYLYLYSPGQGLHTRAKLYDNNCRRLPVWSILSPGQGWHRRANAQKRYKGPPNGQPIN